MSKTCSFCRTNYADGESYFVSGHGSLICERCIVLGNTLIAQFVKTKPKLVKGQKYAE